MRHDRIEAAPPLIDTRERAVGLLAPCFAGLAHEELRVLHLDEELRMLKLGIARGGDTVEVPMREVIRDALLLGSRALVIAHNHPSGDPTPSRADRLATRRLAEVTVPLGIRLVDHLVFAGDRHASFAELGLL